MPERQICPVRVGPQPRAGAQGGDGPKAAARPEEEADVLRPPRARRARLRRLRPRGVPAAVQPPAEPGRGEVGAGDDQPGLREAAGAVRGRNARHGDDRQDGQQSHGDRDNRRVLPSEADQEMDGGQRNRH